MKKRKGTPKELKAVAAKLEERLNPRIQKKYPKTPRILVSVLPKQDGDYFFLLELENKESIDPLRVERIMARAEIWGEEIVQEILKDEIGFGYKATSPFSVLTSFFRLN